jgi:hypothetical protein
MEDGFYKNNQKADTGYWSLVIGHLVQEVLIQYQGSSIGGNALPKHDKNHIPISSCSYNGKAALPIFVL